MKTENMKLKNRLEDIKGNDFKIPEGLDYYDLTLTMIDNIGTIDPVLRDDLIYLVMANWIVNNEFSQKELHNIWSLIIDENHLFYQIGESETDSVFTRTFSLLQLAVLLYKNRDEKFLTDDDLITTKDALINYLKRENDLRGYVEEKGWAHGVAHTADALEKLPYFQELAKDELLEVLVQIKEKMTIDIYPYTNREDERMARAVLSFIRRLTTEEIIEWLTGFTDYQKTGDWNKDDLRQHNSKMFLQSLYFLILADQDLKQITELKKTIEDVLNKL